MTEKSPTEQKLKEPTLKNIKVSISPVHKDIYQDKDKYNEHLLEQYKLYVEMTDRISKRRQTTHYFFLALNTFLVSLLGILATSWNQICLKVWNLSVPAAGIIICITWLRLINSSKQLNSGKFEVIHQIEELLPISPYTTEWKILNKGEGKEYVPFTRVVIWVPWTFIILYATLLIFGAIVLFIK